MTVTATELAGFVRELERLVSNADRQMASELADRQYVIETLVSDLRDLACDMRHAAHVEPCPLCTAETLPDVPASSV